MAITQEQEFANKAVIGGIYHLENATPPSSWDNEDKVRFFKKNTAAVLILLLSLFGLTFMQNNKELQILALTLSGSSASVLLNGEVKSQKKK